MSRLSALRVMRAAAVLWLAVLASTGCDAGRSPPLAPQYSSEGTPDLTRVARYRGGAPQLTIAWAMTWIGPQGGSVRLLDFELIVPPGAVNRITRFAIRLPVDPNASQHVLAEFEPHNITFGAPVTIRLPYRGTSAESFSSNIIWWSGSSWVRYPTTLLPDGRLETTTTHFSEYGTEEPSRGIIPLGG